MSNVQFMHHLSEHCSAKRSGVLALSVAEQTAYFKLTDGQVTYIYFQGRTGLNAMQHLRVALQSHPNDIDVSFRQLDSSITLVDPAIPPTETLLSRFQKQKTPLFPSETTVGKPNHDAGGGGLPARPGMLLSEKNKIILEGTLTEFVGPAASFICAEQLAKVRTLRAAIDALLNELPDNATRERFQRIVRNRVAATKSLNRLGDGDVDINAVAETTALRTLGVMLNAELRQMLLELLPPSTRLSATEIRQQILDRTESMRIAIDYIIEYIDVPAEAEQFKQAVRERYRRLGQVA